MPYYRSIIEHIRAESFYSVRLILTLHLPSCVNLCFLKLLTLSSVRDHLYITYYILNNTHYILYIKRIICNTLHMTCYTLLHVIYHVSCIIYYML